LSFPGLPNQREQAFTEGLRASFPGAADKYWDPSKGVWLAFPSTEWTISDVGIPSPPDLHFKDSKDAFRLIEQSWSEVKVKHADAFFDPRQQGWRTITKRGGTPGSEGDLAERERRAKQELEAWQAQFDAGVLNAEELKFRREEVKRKYRLDKLPS
jgi:hypothetical protein